MEVSDAYRRVENPIDKCYSAYYESGDETLVRAVACVCGSSSHRLIRSGSSSSGTAECCRLQMEKMYTHCSLRTPMENGTSTPACRHPICRSLRILFIPISRSAGDAAFLFSGIDERVESAEVIREEQGCVVVSVRNAPTTHASFVEHGSLVFFWVVPTTGW